MYLILFVSRYLLQRMQGVAGRVVLSRNGPMEAFAVISVNGTAHSNSTLYDGHYFIWLPPGTHHVSLSIDGYSPSIFSLKVAFLFLA